MDFLILNGEIIRKEEANFTHLFWDEPYTITQKIWFGFGGIPMFDTNLEHIYRYLEVLQVKIPEALKNKRELFRITKRMLNKNKFYRSGILNVHLYLKGLTIEYVISSIAYPELNFPISKQGLLVNFSDNIKSSENKLNRFHFYNRANWTINTSRLRNSAFQNSIIVNQKEMVCEGIAANIFMLKDNLVLTPSLDTGCFEDTLRNSVLEAAKLLGLKTTEMPRLKKDLVLEMDEVFFASEELGFQWILGIGNKRFVPKIVFQIHEKLNAYLKEKADERDV